jgi:GLPGLI family protein
MRLTIFILSMLLAATLVGQNTSGIIIYDEIMNIQMDSTIHKVLEDSLKDPQMEQLSVVLEQFSAPQIQKELRFTKEESSFKFVTKSQQDQVESDDGNQVFQFVMMVPEEDLYINLSEGKVIDQREFLDKKFLIKYDLDSLDWKLSGKQKTILGHVCFEAILKSELDSLQPTTAWFCPSIPVASGPDVYGQLPGIILELTTNNGQLSYVASHIEFKEPSSLEITAPTKGKKITQEKYEAIVREKTKEMEINNGGNMVIEIKSF